MISYHILAGTTRVADCPELEREAAVIFVEGRALTMVFDDAADAAGFLEWAGELHSYRWDLNRQDGLFKAWQRERTWDKCPAHDHPEHPCRARVKPGSTLCDDCAGDEEFAVELLAKKSKATPTPIYLADHTDLPDPETADSLAMYYVHTDADRHAWSNTLWVAVRGDWYMYGGWDAEDLKRRAREQHQGASE